jgi:hypothetical protein
MRSVAASLLALLLAFVPAAEVQARRGAQLQAVSLLAALPPAQLTARLKSAHAKVDTALAERRSRFDVWQRAVEDRDAAAARVERMKRANQRGDELDQALRQALVLDEKANLARSQLMSAESRVARSGAELLRVYDALLTVRRRDLERVAAGDARRAKLVRAYQALAQQRDRVRLTLRPVLKGDGPMGFGGAARVEASADDDVETLLEKADLARDLEERFLRRATQVKRRIQELQEERDVAKNVADLVRSQSLYDEDDTRLVIVGTGVAGQRSPVAAFSGGGVAGGGDAIMSVGAPSADSAPPSNERSAEEQAPGGANGDGFTSEPPPPMAPADPTAGAPEAADDADVDLGTGVQDMNEGTVTSPPLGTDVGGMALPRAAERAFSTGATDLDVAALLSSGELSLDELKALEKQLRKKAKRMRSQSEKLRGEVRGRSAR